MAKRKVSKKTTTRKKTAPKKVTKTETAKKPVSARKRKAVAKKKEPEIQRQIVAEQKEAAQILGVTDRTIRNWKDDPACPDCSAGYDIEALREFKDSRDNSSDELRELASVANAKIKEEKAKQEELKTKQMIRDEEITLGNLIPKDEYQLFAIETITEAREVLLPIVAEMKKHLCNKCKPKTSELERMINLGLERLAKLEEGPKIDE